LGQRSVIVTFFEQDNAEVEARVVIVAFDGNGLAYLTIGGGQIVARIVTDGRGEMAVRLDTLL